MGSARIAPTICCTSPSKWVCIRRDRRCLRHRAADGQVDSKFLQHLATDRGASVYTQRNYRQAMWEFHRWHQAGAAAAAGVGRLQRDDFRAYLRFLGRHNLSRAAIQLRFSALRTFYRFLVRHGAVAASPIKNLALPKAGKRLPKFLTPQQMVDSAGRAAEALCRAKGKSRGRPVSAGSAGATWPSSRPFIPAACASASFAGLRAEDIDWNERLVRVRGKGQRNAWSPSASRRWRPSRITGASCPSRRRAGSPVFLAQTRKADAVTPRHLATAPEEVSRHCRPGSPADAAQAAAQLRDPSARRGRGLAQRTGVARPCAPGHDPGLHPPDHGTAQEGLRRLPPPGLTGIFAALSPADPNSREGRCLAMAN